MSKIHLINLTSQAVSATASERLTYQISLVCVKIKDQTRVSIGGILISRYVKVKKYKSKHHNIGTICTWLPTSYGS
jgi:hypothetical protein